MIKDIKLQIKNGINQLEFKIMFALLFIINIALFILNLYRDYGKDMILLRSYLYNFVTDSPSYGLVLGTIFIISPIVAFNIFSSNKWKNEKNGMDLVIIQRMGKKRYYVSLFWSGFILVFLTFFITFSLNFLLNFISYEAIGGESPYGVPFFDLISPYNKSFYFDYVRAYSPILYLFLKIAFISLFVAIISNIPYVLSFNKFLKKYNFISISIGVFLIFNILGVLGRKFSYENFLYGETGRHWIFDISMILLLLLVQVIIIYRSNSYETVDE